MPLRVATKVKTRVTQGIEIAHAISVGIYLIGSVGLASVLGGMVLQLAIQGPHATVLSSDSTNSVSLTWTAPGDDGNVGTAAAYTVKYSTEPLTELTWAAAPAAVNPPTPLVAGSTESFTVTGLTPGTLYNFAVKTTDDAGNESSISNVATKRTDVIACTPTWSCSDWSICSNNTQTRTCIDTSNPPCGSELGRPVESQSCTSPTPQPSQCTEQWSCTGWTACVDGQRTRECNDLNRCGTTNSVPVTTYDCSAGGPLPENPSAQLLATAPAQGGGPDVRVYSTSGRRTTKFLAYSTSFRRGLSIAGGDFKNDGTSEIVVGTGPLTAPQVSMYSDAGRLLLRFFPFTSSLRTGVNVGVGDVDGDGRDDLITAPAGEYPPLIRAFRYDGNLNRFVRFADFSAQGGRFRGGVNLEVGDLNRNGLADIVVSPASSGRGSIIEIYEFEPASGKFVRRTTFSAYASGFSSGVTTAIGDVNGDGNNEIITSPAPGATDVKIFSYSNRRATFYSHFFAAATSFRGGVDLASLDVNGDGRDDIVTVSYSNGQPGLRVFTKSLTSRTFSRLASPYPAFVYSSSFLRGVRLGAF